MSNKYKMFLKDLADHLTISDVETIKFLFANELPAGKAEKLNNSMRLLNAMDHAKLITKTDISQLEFIFNNLPRRDLIPKLESYKEIISNEPTETKTPEREKNSLDVVERKIPKENCSEEQSEIYSTEDIDDSDDAMSPMGKDFTDKIPVVVSLDDEDEKRSLSPPPSEQYFSASGPKKLGVELTPSPGKIELMTPDFFRKTPRSNPKSPNYFNQKDSPELKRPAYPARQRSSQQVRPEEYSMERYPHGDCVIFSNRFDEPVTLTNGHILSKRFGTEKDVMSLKETFEYLKFKVTIYRNQSGDDIINQLRHYAEQKEQESNDCFVICMLSHGYDGGIYGNDGEMLSNKQLKSIFAGDCCQSLINKPKLFFIQACQGEDDGKGVRLEADGPSTQIAQDHLGETGPVLSRRGVVYKEIISTDADFLFFMATTPGTISWRDPVRGSWFVQTLCHVFQENAHCWSLMDMLLTVNNNIALMKQTIDDGMTMAKQMSNFGKNTLRKKLYFFSERDDFEMSNPLKVPSEL